MNDLVAIFVAAVLGVAAFAATLALEDHQDIQRLDRRIDCLERPHGESSVAVQLRPSYKVIQPATRTGCDGR